MAMGKYDTAQICLNGHVVNDSAEDFPHRNQTYCSECGSKTITKCPACGCPIRGHIRSVLWVRTIPTPAFCINCGQAYPWTHSRLEAAKVLVEETESLDQAEKQKLSESLADLVADTPMTPVAATRFKRLMQKIGPAAAKAFQEVLVSVMTEAAKRQV